jgi:hypothetical protein
MAEEKAPKPGRLRRWRERWRAGSERARDIEDRTKQGREGDFDRSSPRHKVGRGPAPGNPFGP